MTFARWAPKSNRYILDSKWILVQKISVWEIAFTKMRWTPLQVKNLEPGCLHDALSINIINKQASLKTLVTQTYDKFAWVFVCPATQPERFCSY